MLPIMATFNISKMYVAVSGNIRIMKIIWYSNFSKTWKGRKAYRNKAAFGKVIIQTFAENIWNV